MPLMVQGSAFYFGNSADSPRVSMPAYFQWIKSVGAARGWPFFVIEEELQLHRRLYCDVDATHFYGVFLSARKAEFQHYVRQDGNRVLVQAVSTQGDPPVEINFFTLRLDSNKGIFSHYLGSYQFTQFLHDLWSTYREWVKVKKDEHLAEIEEGQPRDEVSRLYSLWNRCQHGPLFTPGNFDDLIKQLDTLFEVRMTTYEAEGRIDEPVRNQLKSIHRVYRLTEAAASPKVVEWLKVMRKKSARKLSSGATVHSGSVLGAAQSGAPMCINFENTMEDYLEIPYDKLGSFDISKLKEHALIAEMQKKIGDGVLFAPAA